MTPELSDEALKQWILSSEHCLTGRGPGIQATAVWHECAIRAEKLLQAYAEWVDDLQSGMYVNCVYCGHRYGPGETTPVSMANALKLHISTCPKHPMSELRKLLYRWDQLTSLLSKKDLDNGSWKHELAILRKETRKALE
jgi:hypothetical protein